MAIVLCSQICFFAFLHAEDKIEQNIGKIDPHSTYFPETIGILGDSISTGGATHPSLSPDLNILFQVISNNISVRPEIAHVPKARSYGITNFNHKPKRLWPSTRECFDSFEWVVKNYWFAIGELFLDTEEYSWGFFVAKAMKITEDNIIIAAEDGSRMSSLVFQAERLLEAQNKILPEMIFIFFTGNDLCAPALSLVTNPEEYKNSLIKGVKYLLLNGSPSPRGTKIYVLSFLPLIQLLTTPSILEKKLTIDNKEMTCRKYRKKVLPSTLNKPKNVPPEVSLLGHLLPINPALLCPSIFGSSADESTLTFLGNRIRAFRQALKDSVDYLGDFRVKNFPSKNIALFYINDTSDLNFEGDDIAQDCFHLSINGQSKVADAVLNAVTTTPEGI